MIGNFAVSCCKLMDIHFLHEVDRFNTDRNFREDTYRWKSKPIIEFVEEENLEFEEEEEKEENKGKEEEDVEEEDEDI